MRSAFFAIAALVAFAQPGLAQDNSKDKVLTGKDVTEENLIDALSPKPEDTAGMRTRTLRVGPAAAGAAGAAGAAAAAGTTAAPASPPATGAAAPAANAPAAAGTAGVAAPSSPVADRPSASLLITFHTNSSNLTEPARTQLDVLARAMKADKLKGYAFTLEGHADPRGRPETNLALSQARAESVRDYLVRQHGIAASRLNAIGKGDRELMNKIDPIAPENRRVTIVTRMN